MAKSAESAVVVVVELEIVLDIDTAMVPRVLEDYGLLNMGRTASTENTEGKSRFPQLSYLSRLPENSRFHTQRSGAVQQTHHCYDRRSCFYAVLLVETASQTWAEMDRPCCEQSRLPLVVPNSGRSRTWPGLVCLGARRGILVMVSTAAVLESSWKENEAWIRDGVGEVLKSESVESSASHQTSTGRDEVPSLPNRFFSFHTYIPSAMLCELLCKYEG